MNFTSILLLAVGGYALYSFVSREDDAVAPPADDNVSTNPSGTNTNGQSTVVTAPPTPAVSKAARIKCGGMDLRSWMVYAKNNREIREDQLTYDQWAWLFKETWGVDAPAIEDTKVPGNNRNLLLNIDQWLALTPIICIDAPNGISGINTVAMASPYEMLSIRNVN